MPSIFLLFYLSPLLKVISTGLKFFIFTMNLFTKNTIDARRWCLTPVILTTQEAEIRRITI
jgi:hypothetical protein